MRSGTSYSVFTEKKRGQCTGQTACPCCPQLQTQGEKISEAVDVPAIGQPPLKYLSPAVPGPGVTPEAIEALSARGRGPSMRSRSASAPDMLTNFSSTDAPLSAMSRRRGRPPDASLDERDRLLRIAARRFLPGLPVREQARQLEKALVDFEWGKWRRWRVLDRPPEKFADRIEAVLFEVLKTHPWPPRFETIRKALMQ